MLKLLYSALKLSQQHRAFVTIYWTMHFHHSLYKVFIGLKHLASSLHKAFCGNSI